MKTSDKLIKFNTPYAAIEEINGMAVLYSQGGDYSVVIKISNPILQYAGDSGKLISAQNIFSNIADLVDEYYYLQKQDIFARCKLSTNNYKGDWLNRSYFRHFHGKEYVKNQTYLIITKQAKKNFFTFDAKIFEKFIDNIESIIRLLLSSNMRPLVLDRKMLENYLLRSLAVNFSEPAFSLNNIEVDRKGIHIDDRYLKIMSLIDLDEVNFPLNISPFRSSNRYEDIDFPEDNMSCLLRVPDADTVIYTQTLYMPNQMSEIRRLKSKRNHHKSALGEGNALAATDITNALVEIEKSNKKLVYANYSITIVGKNDLAESASFIERELHSINVVPSKRCINQFELFRAATLPGNAIEMQAYDKFLIPQDAGLCLFYKESAQTDERTNFPVYFCTRDNVPVAIDMFDTVVKTERVPSPHMCVIGPSGSGKSFFMNLYIRQNLARDMDIVLIDIGNSYRGLCEYYKGKYISYSKEQPITMNPFVIKRKEDLTVGKNRFFLSLITVIWRGAEQALNKSEETVILNTVTAYYQNYFSSINDPAYLNFNSFYEFAGEYIDKQINDSKVKFDLDDFRYVLHKYAKGGIYERTLNEEVDKSLIDERFVVFEIDAIKDDPDLYPIVTLVIMDLFTEKIFSRPREIGKIFVIEEAWKSITSPVMQPYIVWLWRTIRKYRGQAVVVTQEIQDLVDNPQIKDVIINNSPIMCLLQQEVKTFKKLVQYLALSDAESNLVASLGRDINYDNSKEVYIKRGVSGEVYRVVVSEQEYWLYTTRNEEKALVEKYRAAYIAAFTKQRREWLATQKSAHSIFSDEELEMIYDADHSPVEYAIEQLIVERKTFIDKKKGLKDDFISYILNPEHSITPNFPIYEKNCK